MCSLARNARSIKSLVALFILATALQGCTGRKSDQERIDDFFRDNPKAKRFTVARFAGMVTIDGQPPEKGAYKLFLLLNDPEHLEKLPVRFTQVADDGSFHFMTYLAGDCVPVGKYVVEFVQLHLRRARGTQRGGVARVFVGPDKLKNLYNDPEKNLENKEFRVDVTEPGRDDYEFTLSVAGKDPVTTPGKYTVTVVPGL